MSQAATAATAATAVQQPLHEQYRPHTYDDVVGQSKALKRLTALRRRGLGGRAFWISGKSGTGKTTIARLIAAEMAGDQLSVEEFDAERLTAKRLADSEKRCQTRPITGGCWAFIVNEAHGLTSSCIRQLLTWIERMPPHCVLIFTTTNEGQADLFGDEIDANPLMSRCAVLALTSQGLRPLFARRVVDIATAEGLCDLEYAPAVKKAERLLKDSGSNLRGAFQEVEAGYLLED